jgi:protein-tyrosine phosphatase
MAAKLDALTADGVDHGIELDSAGTGGWHRGEPADDRARAEAARRGIELTSRARQVHAGDFAYFDLLVAMDRSNRADLLDLAPDAEARAKVRLLLEFLPAHTHARYAELPGRPSDQRSSRPGRLSGHADDQRSGDPAVGLTLDVPDPYYGGPTGFADVFDLIDAACDGLLATVLADEPQWTDEPDQPLPSATPPTSVEGQVPRP